MGSFFSSPAGSINSLFHTAIQGIIGFLNTSFNIPIPPFRIDVPLNVPNLQSTPWGPGLNVYSCIPPICGTLTSSQKLAKLLNAGLLHPALNAAGIPEVQPVTGVSVYCVECYLDVDVTVGGTIAFKLVEGFTSALLSINGDLKASIGLGVDAYAIYTFDQLSRRLITLGVPGFSIPNIFTIGPEVTLDLSPTVTISSEGQLFVGATLDLPNFSAQVDLVNVHGSSTKSTGWTPHYSWAFDAYGTITATASLALPLGIAFGLDALGGKYTLQAALIDTPSVNAIVSYDGGIDLKSDGTCSVYAGTSACRGITWQVNLEDRIDFLFAEIYE